MKKWIFISVIGLLGILYLCQGEDHPIDSCLKSTNGCQVTADLGFYEDTTLVSQTIKSNHPSSSYPYGTPNENEIKSCDIYVDVSAGLKAGVDKFLPFINSLGEFMSESEIKIFKSSFQNGSGISDKPILQNRDLFKVTKELEETTTYNAKFSHLEGTLEEIVKNKSRLSVYITDFLMDLEENNKCEICENDLSWATTYFSDWFLSGGQIIVVTQKAKLNGIDGGNAYALMFIPAKHKCDQLIESLHNKGFTDEYISIFNPLGLDLDFKILDEFRAQDIERVNILDQGPGYVVLGFENDLLTESMTDFAKDLKIPLVDKTGFKTNWNIQISGPTDFYKELNNTIMKSKLLHKNVTIQNMKPISINADGNNITMNLTTIDNRGKNDIIFNKFVIKISGKAQLNDQILTSKIKGTGYNGERTNNCLFSALNKSLNIGGNSIYDKIYSEVPFYTIYTITNVTNNK